MTAHIDISDAELLRLIKAKAINLGGNRPLKIYGTLRCKAGRRMKMENRVFFASAGEAESEGYRPCGHCMKTEYKKWKNGPVQ